MNTNTYLDSIRRDGYKALEPHSFSPSENRWDNIGRWIHEHPTIIKIIQYSVLITGLTLIGALPFAAIGTAALVSMGIAGFVLAGAATATILLLDLLVPPKHDMKTHLFSPAKCDGGELYYHGDIPILTVNTDDPYKAGHAHGYLLGKYLNQIKRRLYFILHILNKRPWTKDIPHVIEEMKKHIPGEYLLEMKGLAEGFNQWAKEHPLSFASQLSLEDVLLFHLIPELAYFMPSRAEGCLEANWLQNKQPDPIAACTTIVDSISEEKGLGIARTMDWSALQGEYQLVVNRVNKTKGISSVAIGVPGFLGTTTAMNSQGLSLIMNVCSGQYHQSRQIQGLASSLLLTYALDNCKNVKEVENLVNEHPPMGPFHLTAADSENQAKAFHFYQGGMMYDETTTIRERQDNKPLITLNHCYPTETTAEGNLHYSRERNKVLDSFFKGAEQNIDGEPEKEKLLEESLKLPYVNNWLSLHSVLMYPKSRKMKVSIGSAFSGKGPFVDIPTDQLFQIS